MRKGLFSEKKRNGGSSTEDWQSIGAGSPPMSKTRSERFRAGWRLVRKSRLWLGSSASLVSAGGWWRNRPNPPSVAWMDVAEND